MGGACHARRTRLETLESRQGLLIEQKERNDMNQAREGMGKRGEALLLIDEGTSGGHRGRSGSGRVRVSWEDLQRLALQGRKARGMDAPSLTQIMR